MKQRKLSVLYVAAILVMVMITVGCNSKKTSEDASKEAKAVEETTTVPPTGYPDGWVQNPYVCASDRLYLFTDDYVKELPGGFVYAGDVSEILTTELPTENFEATCLEEGYKIYLNEDVTDECYVKFDDDAESFAYFKLSDGLNF